MEQWGLASPATLAYRLRRRHTAAATAATPRHNRLYRDEAVYGWLFVAPHVAGPCIFTIGAIIASGHLSAT